VTINGFIVDEEGAARELPGKSMFAHDALRVTYKITIDIEGGKRPASLPK
jgi:hypothetical protein